MLVPEIEQKLSFRGRTRETMTADLEKNQPSRPLRVPLSKVRPLLSVKAYAIDVEAMRCAVQASELAARKRLLDAEMGGRRWAFLQPRCAHGATSCASTGETAFGLGEVGSVSEPNRASSARGRPGRVV
jgi:hypothetical protein